MAYTSYIISGFKEVFMKIKEKVHKFLKNIDGYKTHMSFVYLLAIVFAFLQGFVSQQTMKVLVAVGVTILGMSIRDTARKLIAVLKEIENKD